jgi:hypothetical protein
VSTHYPTGQALRLTIKEKEDDVKANANHFRTTLLVLPVVVTVPKVAAS